MKFIPLLPNFSHVILGPIHGIFWAFSILHLILRLLPSLLLAVSPLLLARPFTHFTSVAALSAFLIFSPLNLFPLSSGAFFFAPIQ